MNKILLGSTALLGALVLAQPASAEITVKLGGYINFTGGFFDHDYLADGNDFDFDNEVEVHVRADGKADNGLLYGVKIELETAGAAQNGDGRNFRTDEANIYVAGTWGRVELGDDDGASDQLAIAAPVAGAGFSDQSDRYGVPATAGDFLKTFDSSDSSKITYFTPTFAGFRAGVSYAPEANEGDATILTDGATGGYTDWIEGGAQYKGEFSGVGVALGATIVNAQGEGSRDDFTQWQLGANLSYAGFTLGGGWIDYDDALTGGGATSITGNTAGTLPQLTAQDGWNLGVSYANGPISASVVYASVDFEEGDYTQWLFDIGYTVAPGLIVGVSYSPYELDVDGGPELDGHAILVGTKMSF
ncbi:porin [Azospirillum sp. ST 5-10]|uniref:porin n=1 Tax=unclassified Azospirillum TaxID=2630922 RepID=UPI003F49FE2C